jgi:deoxyadenosine/deoxycytidine kinase
MMKKIVVGGLIAAGKSRKNSELVARKKTLKVEEGGARER